MDKVIEAEAINDYQIDISPERLTQIAQRFTLAKQNALPGQKTTIRLTKGIILIWNPEVAAATFRNREPLALREKLDAMAQADAAIVASGPKVN